MILATIFLVLGVGCVTDQEPREPVDTNVPDAKDDAPDVGTRKDASIEDDIVNFVWKQDKIRTYVGTSTDPEITEGFKEPPQSDFFLIHFTCFGWETNQEGIRDISARYQAAKTILRGFHPKEYLDREKIKFSFKLPQNRDEYENCYLDIFPWRSTGYGGDWEAVLFQKQVSDTLPTTTEYGTLWYQIDETGEGMKVAPIGFFPMVGDKRWVIPLK